MSPNISKAINIVKTEGLTGLYRALLKYVEGLTLFPLAHIYLTVYKVIRQESLILRQIQGCKMYLNVGDVGISTELFIKGWHERTSTQIFKELLKPEMNILDIGANIGYYVLLEAKRVLNGIVYAVEPDPYNFLILNQNIRINGLNNVKTFNIAISDKEDLAKFYLSKRSNLHSLINYGHSIKEIIVKTVTLDEFLKDKEVNFIRMDVEGAEYEILKGAHKTLEREDLKLFIEFHPNLLKIRAISISDLLKKLEEFGFNPMFIVLKDTEKVFKDITLKEALKNPLITSYPFHAFLEK
jgi:FkbM family methyltransferase